MANFEDVSPDYFAALVLQHLTDLGEQDPTYDSDEFLIELSDGFQIYLGNVFRETQGLSADERNAQISRFVSVLQNRTDEPESWPDARPLLRPILRSVTYGIGSPSDAKPLSRPVFPFVNELVVIDRPDTRVIVVDAKLAEWGVSADEVFAAARDNLAELAEPHDPDGDAILRYVDNGDSYFSSWPLVPGWLAGFRKHYGHRRPVAFMPDTDTLIVVPDVPELIEQMYEIAEEQFHEATRPLSPQGYTLDADDNVVPFDQAGPHEQLPAAARARCGLAVTEYSAQTEWINDTFERDYELADYGIDPAFAGSVMYAALDDGPSTITIWGEGVEYLLPEADYVAFCRTDDDGAMEKMFEVPFTSAIEITGLTPIPDLSPPRYEVRTWPTPAMLTQLEQAAVTLQ